VCARIYLCLQWCIGALASFLEERAALCVCVCLYVYMCVFIFACVCVHACTRCSRIVSRREKDPVIVVGYEYVYIHMYIFITCVHKRLYV